MTINSTFNRIPLPPKSKFRFLIGIDIKDMNIYSIGIRHIGTTNGAKKALEFLQENKKCTHKKSV